MFYSNFKIYRFLYPNYVGFVAKHDLFVCCWFGEPMDLVDLGKCN